MRLVVAPGGRIQPIDRAPTVIHIVTSQAVAAGVSIVGADYTVPAGRRAIMQYGHGTFRLLATMPRTFATSLFLNYTPSGGALAASTLAAFIDGVGPELWNFAWQGPAQLLAGDRMHFSTTATASSPATNYSDTLHGIEYDE